ncbi:MAG: COG1470 family protein [Promethearchaeota archaeon]
MISNTNITPHLRENKKQDNFRKILSLVLITFMIINFMYFSYNNYQNNIHLVELPTQEFYDENDSDLNPSAGISLFQDPFTVNFEKIWQFFNGKYQTELEMGVDTYFRSGNVSGIITDDTVYPIDTLTLYNTLLRDEFDWMELYDNYLALKTSPFWYEGESQFSYGFVSSVDNSTRQINDDRRSLIDNLMPISMLIENMGANIASIYNSDPLQYPKDSIEEMVYLINSSQFWDADNIGFSEYNSTDFTENKDTKSNLYAILATLQIRNAYEQLGLNPTIKNRVYELANMTMDILLNNMWDDSDDGFYNFARDDWSTGGLSGATYKYLDVNALGIITLLEYWLETGMTDSTLLDKAIATYEKIEQNLEYGTNNAYYYSIGSNWFGIEDYNVDLEANSLFMLACLKLFELTGNLTFYNTAFDLHYTFETNFYDSSVNSYDNSIFSPVDDGKNLNANLKLIDAYMKAVEIYSSTILKSSFNISSEVPDFIFNEHELNIDTIYQLEKDFNYFNYTTMRYETSQLQFNITSADITYIFKYPNGTLFEILNQAIISNVTTFKYAINDSLPIGQNYHLYIYANSSMFGIAQILKNFNVISGLVNHTILGLPDILYQGPTLNITLPVNNTRSENVTLTITMEEGDIITESQILLFPSMVLTNASFNLTARLGAAIGSHNISFKFELGNILYLEVIKVVNIGHSFDYTNLIHKNKVVKGQSIQVSFNMINFLPNSTQSMNVTFRSPYIQNIKEEITLLENEVRLLLYNLLVSEDIIEDSITIDMDISKGDTIYYTKSIEIEIIPIYEVLNVFFPQVVAQGNTASFTLIIKNNKETSETFSLYVNGEKWTTNINGLAPGENRIIAEVIPTLIPYDFIAKTFTFELRDSTGETIVQYYFEVSIELSPTNLILFYVLPILIPIGIILFFKNKELKHKLLRR